MQVTMTDRFIRWAIISSLLVVFALVGSAHALDMDDKFKAWESLNNLQYTPMRVWWDAARENITDLEILGTNAASRIPEIVAITDTQYQTYLEGKSMSEVDTPLQALAQQYVNDAFDLYYSIGGDTNLTFTSKQSKLSVFTTIRSAGTRDQKQDLRSIREDFQDLTGKSIWDGFKYIPSP